MQVFLLVVGIPLTSRAEVVNITPLGESFLQHVDLSLEAGFTFTEANQTTQYNLNATGTIGA